MFPSVRGFDGTARPVIVPGALPPGLDDGPAVSAPGSPEGASSEARPPAPGPRPGGAPPSARRPPAEAPASPPAAVRPAAFDETAPWRRLAHRLGVDFLDRIETRVEPETSEPPAAEAFRRTDVILVGEGVARRLVAAPNPAAVASVREVFARDPEVARRVAIATPREIRRALVARHSAALVRRAVRAILDRDPKGSAADTVSLVQIIAILVVVGAWIAAVFDLSRTLLFAWTVLFLGIGLLRAHVADAVTDPPDHPPLAEAALPRFAVLVPLFREAAVVADLVAALLHLDFPPDRLDLRLVVEEDDAETRAAAETAVAGTAVELIVVPKAEPRTKPKALNFALRCVDAPFVSVFDAEDRPDPDQLRKAAAAFRAGGDDLAVVQAALEIDHADGARSWLVRQFEIEYAVLFHGVLPFLARRRLFLPLGGTSNHFRASHPLLPQENLA